MLASSLLIVIYGIAVGLSIWGANRLPPASKEIEDVWDHLQVITTNPHPYDSLANEFVSDYISSEMQKMVEMYPDLKYVHQTKQVIITDSETWRMPYNYMFSPSNHLLYIPSLEESSSSLLVSAHFDSVSTGFGATDNGMSVAVCISLFEYYAVNRPINQSILFVLNNAEEDGLLGALSVKRDKFFQNANITSFINLDGAGAGGKSILFRNSNVKMAQGYKGTDYPLISTLMNDFFSSGVIRSDTDYSAYVTGPDGIPGLDIAFYRNRALYHTPLDNIRTTSKESVEHLYRLCQHSITKLTSSPISSIENDSEDKSVAISFIGVISVVFKQIYMHYANLGLGLFMIIVLGIFYFFIPNKISMNGNNSRLFNGIGVGIFSIVFSASMTALSLIGIGIINPAVLHSKPFLILALVLLIPILFLTIPIQIYCRVSKCPHEILTARILMEISLLFFVALCVTGVLSNIYDISSVYLVFCSTAAVFLSTLLYMFKNLVLDIYIKNRTERSMLSSEPSENSPLLADDSVDDRPPQYVAISPEYEESIQNAEITSNDRHNITQMHGRKNQIKDNFWWVFNLLLVIPLPVLLISDVLIPDVIYGLHQTLPNGSASLTVYGLIGCLGVWSSIFAAPFLSRMSLKTGTIPIMSVTIILYLWALIGSPFDSNSPLNLYFEQKVNLDTQTNIVSVLGFDKFIDNALDSVPSAYRNGYTCGQSTRGNSIKMCQYEGIQPNVLSVSPFNATSLSHNATNSLITLEVYNSKICEISAMEPTIILKTVNSTKLDISLEKPFRLYFDSWESITEIELEHQWADISLTISCFYDEKDNIESYREISGFIPDWSIAVKQSTGILKAFKLLHLI